MIFRIFNNDKGSFLSNFGILGTSGEDIVNRFKKMCEVLNATNDYTIANIVNSWKNSSVKKDLSDKFFITQSDIEDKLIKDFSVYEQNPQNILNKLLDNNEKVDAGQK